MNALAVGGLEYMPIQPVRHIAYPNSSQYQGQRIEWEIRATDADLDRWENSGGALIFEPVPSSGDPVCDAVLAHDVPALALLLQRGGSPNSRAKDGWTALGIACDEKSVACVQLLLTRRANTGLPGNPKTGGTPLIIAAGKGGVDCVRLLLSAGAHVDHVRSEDGVTPLYMACQHMLPDVVDTLLAANADVNKAASDGLSPLHAVFYGHAANPGRVEAGSDPEDPEAADADREACLRSLLAHGAAVNVGPTLPRYEFDVQTRPLDTAAFLSVPNRISARCFQILFDAGAKLQYQDYEGGCRYPVQGRWDEGNDEYVLIYRLCKELHLTCQHKREGGGSVLIPGQPNPESTTLESFNMLEAADAASRLGTSLCGGCLYMELTGLQSRPELNGSRVRVERYDLASDRFQVTEMATGASLSARAQSLQIAAVELAPRRCRVCNEAKPQGAYTRYQWRKRRDRRRCKACQASGILTSWEELTEQQEREREAAEMAALHQERVDAELAKIQAELARRNAMEPDDNECPVCFEDIRADEKCTLPCNAKHWLCRACLAQLVQTSHACPHCRATAGESALRALVEGTAS